MSVLWWILGTVAILAIGLVVFVRSYFCGGQEQMEHDRYLEEKAKASK